jgi:hypothetical protein
LDFIKVVLAHPMRKKKTRINAAIFSTVPPLKPIFGPDGLKEDNKEGGHFAPLRPLRTEPTSL